MYPLPSSHIAVLRKGERVASLPVVTLSSLHNTLLGKPSQIRRSVYLKKCLLTFQLITEPACGTCRKKSRKCDRKRPICDRCRTRGLHCEGYPPRFQFREILTTREGQQSSEVTLSNDPLPLSTIMGLAESVLELPAVPETTFTATPSVDHSVTESLDNSLPESAEDLPQDSSVSNHSSASSPISIQPPATRVSVASPLVVVPQLQNEVIANQPIIEYCKISLDPDRIYLLTIYTSRTNT